MAEPHLTQVSRQPFVQEPQPQEFEQEPQLPAQGLQPFVQPFEQEPQWFVQPQPHEGQRVF